MIQTLLGHSDAKTSQRYIHLTGAPELRETVKGLWLPAPPAMERVR